MKISIIGGGITGLTTALALQKLGFECEVYERAKELNEVGAGIWIQPNAIKVFDWLGIGDKIRAAGVPLGGAEITNNQLVPFRKTNATFIADEKGNRITSLHRARLQKVLFDALPEGTVHFDAAYVSHKVEAEQVILQLSGKSTVCDYLIGADGIHSKVRQSLFKGTALRYSGQTCWRGIAQMELPEAFMAKGYEAWGKGGRFGFAPIADNEVYWFAVANAPQGEQDAVVQRKEMLLQKYSAFSSLVTDIIKHTPTDKMLRNDISDLKRLNTWYSDSVLLLGDAAHATTPNMGQGAGQGIEDAYYFSNILKQQHGNFPIASQNFEAERRKKVDFVVNNSWTFGQMAHGMFGRFMMKAVMKLLPESMMMKQMQDLFHIKEY